MLPLQLPGMYRSKTRAVTVVVAGVPSEDRPQVPLVIDEHPVGALGARGSHPPLGIAVGPRRPRRSPDGLHALTGEDLVEGAGELGVAAADEEAELGDLATEVHDEVAGLLSGPCAVWVGGDAEDVHVPGRHLRDEQYVQAFEEDRVHVEEIAGQQAVSLGAQERPPGRVRVLRGRSAPPGAQDPPHGRLADLVSEPGQLAVHPAVPPGRVLLGQLQYKVADFLAGPWATWPVRIRPLACDQAAVPGQQRARRDDPMGAQHGWQQPGERRQDCPVGPVRLRPGDLTPQHRDLMTENHDLRILGRLPAAEQHEPAEYRIAIT